MLKFTVEVDVKGSMKTPPSTGKLSPLTSANSIRAVMRRS